ncbi:AhpC/TSA family protein [Tieghemostelium lacteum]|uniref:AhpC/TSA family protein n=1 Tax=Tieghemostelium lacteum TaxID=361077 RepID=A0A152A800_TIELA|nr:AhpC/TSA family protein [Tieghemostelium lacteum]|eukprot:KYR02370.1 AhpC/TSA family protein [Tieghemostelium lacteum]
MLNHIKKNNSYVDVELDDAPDFKSHDMYGNTITLNQFRDKILILYFYPHDKSSESIKEALEFRDKYEQFIRNGAVVVGVSGDSSDSHKEFSKNYNIPFTLIVDDDHKLAKKYGVKTHLFTPTRTLFIIDQNQKIIHKCSSHLNCTEHISESLNTTHKMASSVTVKDVSASDFIATYARFLKKTGRVQIPKWVDIVKTATHKELPPTNPDWIFVRIAVLARKVYLRQGDGVATYRRCFGGNQRDGVRPNHFHVANGGVIRYCLKQLQNLKVVEVDASKGGRKITSTGRRDLDRIAKQIHDKKNKQ